MLSKQDIAIDEKRVVHEVSDNTLHDALQTIQFEAQFHNEKILSAPALLWLLRQLPSPFYEHPLFKKNAAYACFSEEIRGKTAQGTDVVLVSHNGCGPLLSKEGPQKIRAAYDETFKNQYQHDFKSEVTVRAPLTDQDIHLLCDGKFPDGSTGVRVFETFKEFYDATFSEEECRKLLFQPYVVILDFKNKDEAQKWSCTYKYYQSSGQGGNYLTKEVPEIIADIENLRHNKLMIARSGGVAAAYLLADYLIKTLKEAKPQEQMYKTIQNLHHHPFSSSSQPYDIYKGDLFYVTTQNITRGSLLYVTTSMITDQNPSISRSYLPHEKEEYNNATVSFLHGNLETLFGAPKKPETLVPVEQQDARPSQEDLVAAIGQYVMKQLRQVSQIPINTTSEQQQNRQSPQEDDVLDAEYEPVIPSVASVAHDSEARSLDQVLAAIDPWLAPANKPAIHHALAALYKKQ